MPKLRELLRFVFFPKAIGMLRSRPYRTKAEIDAELHRQIEEIRRQRDVDPAEYAKKFKEILRP